MPTHFFIPPNPLFLIYDVPRGPILTGLNCNTRIYPYPNSSFIIHQLLENTIATTQKQEGSIL